MPKKAKDEISFEAALTRLAEIAKELEGGEVKLEDSVSLFEEGVMLSKLCRDALKEAEDKVIELGQMSSKDQ